MNTFSITFLFLARTISFPFLASFFNLVLFLEEYTAVTEDCFHASQRQNSLKVATKQALELFSKRL